jgi:hypothetical protein
LKKSMGSFKKKKNKKGKDVRMELYRFFRFFVLSLFCSGLAWADAYVGYEAPDFRAKDINGQECSLSQFKGKIVVLEWTNPKCPFTRKQYSMDNENGIGAIPVMQKRYSQPSVGVVWITIASSAKNGTGYLDAEGWKTQLQQWKASPTALIIDESGEIASLFDARRTPEVFVIGKDGTILYKGAVDSLRGTDPNEVTDPINLHWFRNAIENALQDRRVVPPETIPYGCPIR